MPRKVRRPKRHVSDEAERIAWSGVFESGFDFFDDLEPFGVIDPVRVWPQADRDEAARKFTLAARAAWRRFGEAYMAAFQPNTVRVDPWAFKEFGDPKTCR